MSGPYTNHLLSIFNEMSTLLNNELQRGIESNDFRHHHITQKWFYKTEQVTKAKFSNYNEDKVTKKISAKLLIQYLSPIILSKIIQ